MSLVQSVKTLAEEESNKNNVVSNSTLLQKRLQLLAPSDDSDSETESEEQVTPKKETPTRHNRSNSWLNWFSWYSITTKPHIPDSPPTPETTTPKQHEISSPYQVEHTMHLQDLSPESSSNTSANTVKDISLLLFQQKERIKDLQRDNDLKDEYIKQLEEKVREMHEQKMFAKERYNKLKHQYDELAERTSSDNVMWNSVASTVLGASNNSLSVKLDAEKVVEKRTTNSSDEDDFSCFTSPLKRNNNNGNADNCLLSPTPDLDALLDKMGLDD